tara:strand:- start:397 stop:1479 length:1083 start_codon:yes stop_codon:yes gene_type:complete
MKPAQLKVLHLSKYPARQGGMDTLLRLHSEHGENVQGLLKHEKLPSIGFNALLPFNWQRKAHNKLERISAEHDVSLYYNCWGADVFSKYDHAAKRIGYIHNHFPNFEKYIRHFSSFLDGFLTVNPATTELTRRILRDTHPPENIQTVPLPIDPPTPMPEVEKGNIIGLVGRINYEQKRYDKLAEFAKLLAKSRPDMRIEVLGDGPRKSDVMKATQGLARIKFLPWSQGLYYWEILSSWKFVLFLSDYEGLPISLLESLYAGCIPIYPDFHSGHKQGLPLELYDPEELISAVQKIERIAATNFKTPKNCHRKLSAHTKNRYITSLHQAVGNFKEHNRIAEPFALNQSPKSYNKKYKELINK